MRRWLGFIGFYTPSIRRAFVAEARRSGLTGFLMSGKPAVAALEGSRSDIDRFIAVTRTQLFASVPPASRKMSVMLDETGLTGGAGLCDFSDCRLSTAPGLGADAALADAGFGGGIPRAFSSFDEIELRCEPGTHARGDTADLGALRSLLDARGLSHVPLSALFP